MAPAEIILHNRPVGDINRLKTTPIKADTQVMELEPGQTAVISTPQPNNPNVVNDIIVRCLPDDSGTSVAYSSINLSDGTTHLTPRRTTLQESNDWLPVPTQGEDLVVLVRHKTNPNEQLGERVTYPDKVTNILLIKKQRSLDDNPTEYEEDRKQATLLDEELDISKALGLSIERERKLFQFTLQRRLISERVFDLKAYLNSPGIQRAKGMWFFGRGVRLREEELVQQKQKLERAEEVLNYLLSENCFTREERERANLMQTAIADLINRPKPFTREAVVDWSITWEGRF